MLNIQRTPRSSRGELRHPNRTPGTSRAIRETESGQRSGALEAATVADHVSDRNSGSRERTMTRGPPGSDAEKHLGACDFEHRGGGWHLRSQRLSAASRFPRRAWKPCAADRCRAASAPLPAAGEGPLAWPLLLTRDRKSTRLNSSP